MDTIELSDPDGDALTVMRGAEGIWITCAGGEAEATVGPLAAATLRDALAGPGDHERRIRPPRPRPRCGRMVVMAPPLEPRTAADAWRRDDLAFRALAGLWIITGGLVAAVTAPLGLEHGSWSAAFQVLVGGVLQAGLGIAQHALAGRRTTCGTLLAEILTWNLGCLAVIGGTLLTAPLLVDLGGLLLVATMVLMIRAVGRGARGPVWALWTYRAVLLLTIASIPIGLVLAHLRAG
ncbi:hypothetical protein [Brachybacterium vulturis]|uniref:hypothetical protein n=1 Tax=Brachybacterium vulturis TaxID=2017484 RepID=UPI00373690E7